MVLRLLTTSCYVLAKEWCRRPEGISGNTGFRMSTSGITWKEIEWLRLLLTHVFCKSTAKKRASWRCHFDLALRTGIGQKLKFVYSFYSNSFHQVRILLRFLYPSSRIAVRGSDAFLSICLIITPRSSCTIILVVSYNRHALLFPGLAKQRNQQDKNASDH